ncbi:MAG: AbrB/MazE/SpoVT family DNA-binding domain-containing protein [Chloroflexi bacterium]|nr:AbrB/MazE/SpoVT family DNA-binding domain-containing protein [Chloroflexota bacterium]
MTEQVKLATVQKRGQVTIPIELRRKFGIEEGGIVAFTETEEGILISPREVLAMDALDRIGKVLKERGITLEQLIESGREIRGQIIEEEYGFSAEKER